MKQVIQGEVSEASAVIAATREAVALGLSAPKKSLPFWLLYDAAGSALYEQIMRLPEYYPTRTERAIFDAQGAEILATALGAGPALGVVVAELGAGNAEKTAVLLKHLPRLAPGSRYMPIDVSPSALEAATRNVLTAVEGLTVAPLVAMNDAALEAMAAQPERRIVLFIGSSIGNLDDTRAVERLEAIRAVLGGGALVLGTDLAKDPAVLLPAYDDAAGVTAAFNLNLLTRINRELGADFVLEQFKHVADWDAEGSQVELYLESLVEQVVQVPALGRTFAFGAGERIHTESSTKYDLARIDRLLAAAGLERVRSFMDEQRWFAVHVAVEQRAL